MRTLIVCLLSLSLNFMSFGEVITISDWVDRDGITESEAVQMTVESVSTVLLVNDAEGECGVEANWGFQLIGRSNLAEHRFTVRSFALGPYPEKWIACSGTTNYECRSYFGKDAATGQWKVDYASCDADDSSESD